MTSLANAFEASICAAAGRRTEDRPARASRSRSARPARQRRLGPDDGEIDVVGLDRADQAVLVVRSDGEIGGERRGAGIARCAEEVGGGEVAAERPAQRMFAAAASDDQYPHPFWALRKASPRGGRRLLGRVGDVVHRVAGRAGVVILGGLEVVPERPLLLLGAAAGVFAAQDALVVAALNPLLQLRRAHRVHRVRQRQRVQDLVDDVQALVGL